MSLQSTIRKGSHLSFLQITSSAFDSLPNKYSI